jgi:hypothetical protein
MSRYRRAKATGSSYFFTVVAYTGGSRFYVTKRFVTHCYVRDGVYAHDWAVAMESAMPGYD